MANIKITDLTAYGNPTSTDVLPIVDVGADVTKKVSVADLLENAGSGTEALPGIAFDGDPDTGIYRPDADQLAISTNGAQHLLIDSNGDINIDSGGVFYDATNKKLGVGDTGPSETLTVKGASSVDPFSVSGSSSEFLRVDNSGRLLVGTSSNIDDYSCQVDTFSDAVASFTRYGSDSARIRIGSSRGTQVSRTALNDLDFGGYVQFDGYTGSEFLPLATIGAFCDGQAPAAGDSPGGLVFSTTADGASSPTEHLFISSQGYVIAGVDPAFDLSGAACGPGIKIVSATALTDARLEGVSGSTATRYHAAFTNPNGIVGSISTNGSATAFNTSSDYRLKENVVPLTGATDRLNQLQVRRFNFIADPDNTVDGFLAHEAQAVVPECVTGTKDAVDENGKPQYQGIDQSKLVPLLTAALQEAIGRIETLEAEVAALKAS